MRTIEEGPRTTPVLCETDVLVVGGGPGGLAAAVSAAREGAHTTLLDRYGCFGGVITQVGVESVAWYRHEGTTDVEGIGIEFEQRAKAFGGTQPESQSCSEALDPELFKCVADELVREAGVEPLLHCLAVAPIVADGAIGGVVIESKSGRQAVLARARDRRHRRRRHRLPRRRALPHDAGGRDDGRQRRVLVLRRRPRALSRLRQGERAPTYKDWTAGWRMETSGKEDDLFSPFLQEPFDLARAAGIIPESITSIGGTWSRISDSGEATGLNLVYLSGYDCTDVARPHARRDRGPPPGAARHRSPAALRPGLCAARACATSA